jgi:O-antigen ligase
MTARERLALVVRPLGWAPVRELAPGLGRGPHRAAALAAGLLAVVLGLALPLYPWVTTGAVVGGVLLVLLFFHPLVVLGLMLAAGPLDLSFLTGGYKGMFEALGGFDFNGVRLVMLVCGLSLLVLTHPRLAGEALSKHGRIYALFLVYAAATLVYSLDPLHGLRFLFKLALPFLVFVAVLGLARSREELLRMGTWILAGAALIALLINPLYALSGGYDYDFLGHIRFRGPGRAHQNPFAFYLILMILLAYARFSVRGQLRYLALCGIFGVWLVLTVARIALAGALAGLAGAALFVLIVDRNYRAVFVSIGIAAAVMIPFLPAVLSRTFGFVPGPVELWQMVQNPVELYHSMYWLGREMIWPIIFSSFMERPIFGHGIGSEMVVTLRYIPPEGGAIVHNEYLRLAMDTGVIGVMLYASAIVAWAAAVLRAARLHDPAVREFAIPAVGGLCVWVVVAFTDNAFDYYSSFTQFIGFFCAASIAAARFAGASTEAEAPPGIHGDGVEGDAESPEPALGGAAS